MERAHTKAMLRLARCQEGDLSDSDEEGEGEHETEEDIEAEEGEQ
jgi:hypothetical protein